MSAELAPRRFYTEEEYLLHEAGALERHEFYDGQIYLMAAGSPAHAVIAVNVAGELRAGLRDKPCDTRGSDQRIKVAATGLLTYPDVAVVCPPYRYAAVDKNTLVDATVLVEILSRSTRAYDLGVKFEHYRLLPSLRHYLVLEQDRVEVEHRQRKSLQGPWETEVFYNVNDEVYLASIDCRLKVRHLYEKVEFSPE